MASWGHDKETNKMSKNSLIPRLLWVRKDSTMKDLHFEIFKHMRFVFSEWADWSHPDTSRTPTKDNDLTKLPPFPYRRNPEDPQMKKEEFDALSDEEAFSICCKAIIESGSSAGEQSSYTFDLSRGAYQLEFKNTAGMYSQCKLCGSDRCKSCLVPFGDNSTVKDQLTKLSLTANDTLFEQMSF